MAFKLLENKHASHLSEAAYITVAAAKLWVSVGVKDVSTGDRVVIEVDAKAGLIRLTKTTSPWAFAVAKCGLRSRSIMMNRGRHKRLGMPFGHYILKKKDGAALTFAKVGAAK